MNALHPAHPFSDTEYKESTDIFSVLGEPEDPASFWSELRCAQLSGYDYFFLSAKINSKLANKTALGEFLLDLYQIMDSSHDRAKIYIYTENSVGKPEFARFTVNWEQGEAKDFRVTPIKNLEQKDFIRTIYDHSGMLVGSA